MTGTLFVTLIGTFSHDRRQLELARLRREVAQVKMERDILKKAAAYFARESQEGTR